MNKRIKPNQEDGNLFPFGITLLHYYITLHYIITLLHYYITLFTLQSLFGTVLQKKYLGQSLGSTHLD